MRFGRWRFGLLSLMVLLLTGLSPERAFPGPEDADVPKAPWTRCLDALPWFHQTPVPNMEARLLELAGQGKLAAWSEGWIRDALRRAPEFDSFLGEAKRRGKLLFWYVPSVAGQQVILPHFLDRYMSIGPLSDPDLVTILRERCVCVKLPAGGVLAERFDLVAPKVIEPACLLMTSGGDVVWRADRISQFDTDWLRRQIEAALPTLPRYRQGPTSPDDGAGERSDDRAARKARFRAAIGSLERDLHAALKGGDITWAFRLTKRLQDCVPGWASLPPSVEALPGFVRLAVKQGSVTRPDGSARHGPSTGAAFFHAARALRRAARPALALKALGWAEVVGDAPSGVTASIPVERGRCELSMGTLAVARASFAGAVEVFPKGARRAEAAYWLGVVDWFGGTEADADAAWKQCAVFGPETIWAARASACLAKGTDGHRGESPLTRSMVDPRDAPVRLDADAAMLDDAALRARALAFLLIQQRDDGRFEGSRWGGPGKPKPGAKPKPGHVNMEVAITALCAAAIDTCGDDLPLGAATALSRAEAWLLSKPSVIRGDEIVWVYADAFRLLHFARRLPRLAPAVTKRVRVQMRAWVDNLVAHQRETGGSFKHYVYQSTFVTASVLHCLHVAAGAGIPVPGNVFAKGGGVLIAARDEASGLFGYLLSNPRVTRTPVGAAQRGPLCTYALFRSGLVPKRDLVRAVDLYVKMYPTVARRARHANFHIPALDHTAGYYFWHDFFYACLAARTAGREAAIKALRAWWRELPGADGSFVDAAFSYGKAYGTAMALLSLDALQPRR